MQTIQAIDTVTDYPIAVFGAQLDEELFPILDLLRDAEPDQVLQLNTRSIELLKRMKRRIGQLRPILHALLNGEINTVAASEAIGAMSGILSPLQFGPRLLYGVIPQRKQLPHTAPPVPSQPKPTAKPMAINKVADGLNDFLLAKIRSRSTPLPVEHDERGAVIYGRFTDKKFQAAFDKKRKQLEAKFPNRDKGPVVDEVAQWDWMDERRRAYDWWLLLIEQWDNAEACVRRFREWLQQPIGSGIKKAKSRTISPMEANVRESLGKFKASDPNNAPGPTKVAATVGGKTEIKFEIINRLIPEYFPTSGK